MLRGDGVGFEIALEAFSPDGVEALGVEAGQEVGARRASHAMRRVEVILPAEEAAVVRRVPVLAGVAPGPGKGEQAVDVRHDLEAAGDGSLPRAQRRDVA